MCLQVTLGQTPSDDSVQSLALQQLTGARFSGDEPVEQRNLELQRAMRRKKLLFVIDDCWDSKHEALLNFVDVESGSKVLLSSRVRNVIDRSSAQSTAVVNIELPSEDDALQMLISTAGMTAKGVAKYRRDNPGSKLKTAVTGKVKPGSKAAKRRKSFCARSAGQMKQFPKAAKNPNSRLRQARRRWKC